MYNKNIAVVPLVHELPCRHITASFGPCLSNVTVYKWKTITNIGTKLGFKTESHKLLLITPFYSDNDNDNNDNNNNDNNDKSNKSFESFILELNFGSKTILSSGAYMQCLNCAKFINDNMIQCSPSFICCIEKDFIINIMETFINTIRFFGPRKCNCQSYVYYILRCFGVADNLLLDANIVETDFGYIHLTVKQLAINMEYHRPTCQGHHHHHQYYYYYYFFITLCSPSLLLLLLISFLCYYY